MSVYETILSNKEKQWISERRVTRLTDNKEVQIYPMGAERYLSSVLLRAKKDRYTIRTAIEGKNVLVIPGHGNTGFLFAQAGAQSVTVYDKDPVTVSWIKAFKKYYYYRGQGTETGSFYPSVGELLTALNQWYPPLITLPSGKYSNVLLWVLNPDLLRRKYIHYMVSLVCQAVHLNVQGPFELEKKIFFHTGTISDLLADKNKATFDTAFIPYLLGIKNGIEQEKDIVHFMKQLMILIPQGIVAVSPSRNTKEFYIVGKRYLNIPGYSTIRDIPELNIHVTEEDRYWMRTQGLAIFRKNSEESV